MKVFYGYIAALIGLIGLGLNSTTGRKYVGFIELIPANYFLIGSLVFIVLGVVIMIVMGKGGGSKKIKQVEKEVPIYRGEGKKRKIVGYIAED